TDVPFMPKSILKFTGFLSAIFLFAAGFCAAEDPNLSTAGAGFAPMDVKSHDPMVPISKTQRDEFYTQFKGLIAMGLSQSSFEHWGGQSMADCETPASADTWCHKCEIDMPDANGVYYFYPSSKGARGTSCTLQQVDIHVRSSEEVLLQDF